MNRKRRRTIGSLVIWSGAIALLVGFAMMGVSLPIYQTRPQADINEAISEIVGFVPGFLMFYAVFAIIFGGFIYFPRRGKQ